MLNFGLHCNLTSFNNIPSCGSGFEKVTHHMVGHLFLLLQVSTWQSPPPILDKIYIFFLTFDRPMKIAREHNLKIGDE